MNREFVAILIASAATAVSPAAATTVLPIDVDGLSSYSETIVAGTVTAVRSDWTPDHRHIFTEVTFGDVEYLKGGEKAKSHTFRMMGGTVGDLTMEVSGRPRFEVGERSLVFLYPDNTGWMPILGWTQGRFRIRDGGVLTDAGHRVVGVEDGRLVVEGGSAEPAAAAEAAPGILVLPGPGARKYIPRQYPDREEEIPPGMSGPKIVPRGAARTPRMFPERDEDGCPIGRGPIVVAAGSRTPISDSQFLAAVRALARAGR